MTFSHFARRLHLYLALSLLPWFFMYALSSMAFSHPGFFDRFVHGDKKWQPRFSKIYDGGISAGADERDRNEFARRIVKDHGLDCSYDVSPVRDGRIDVWCFTFFSRTHLTYDLASSVLSAEDKRAGADDFLTGMHARGGFQRDGLLDDFWAVVVDLFCAGLMIWVATGIYMWWKLPKLRLYGAISLIAGCSTFMVFMITL